MSETKRTVKVQAGAITRTIEVPADVKTVDQLKEKLGRIGVTSEHTAYNRTSGAGSATAVDGSAAVEDGMTFEFTRTTGQKG